MSVFLQRLSDMEKGKGPFQKGGKAARALLAERGLTQDIVDEATQLIAQVGQATPALPAAAERPSDDTIQAAEDAMWAWYREWGTIARTVVTSRRELRRMGFLGSRTSGDTDEANDTPVDTPVDANAPTEPQLSAVPAPRRLTAANQEDPVAAE